MRYEGNIFRPPSEARSLILQITIGCAHNKCTFCGMFKEKNFRVRDVNEVIEDINAARKKYSYVEKIFLADGDALCLANDKLLYILNHIGKVFPECSRVGIYGSPHDALRKSVPELIELKNAGLGIVYIGAESGSDEVLKKIKKGVSASQIIEGVKKIEEAGILASVTFISGLGGKVLWKDHAIETGKMISQMGASYVSLLTLMLENETELFKDIKNGNFEILSAEEILVETKLMMENVFLTKKCIFRSNHASNYVSLKGELPQDKDEIIKILDEAMKDRSKLKDERFRML